ncbi:uncharacterized protein LOC116777279 [Danaus plexippus]|nr:uncharacterized protein LOC116777279 [Danaus plexippus]XP_061382055.1 uncharacterized protein LOC116777279 [Danaus plexippus]
MEQYLLAVATITSFISTVSSLQCYQCLINPPPGQYYNTTKRLCSHFDHSDTFVVECPFSTMCMKQEFYLDIQNGVRISAVLRDCAPQKHAYHDIENGRWFPKTEVLEPYNEGCTDIDNDKGERTTPTSFCYCRENLCNTSPNTSQEGYTDIMGVIMVFNLMKFINSLR